MNKKLFVLLIVLMSLSLLGIVFVQRYWISNAYKTKQEQFNISVRQVLLSVAKKIQLKEIEAYYQVYSKMVQEIEVPDSVSFTELIYKIQNRTTNEIYLFTDGILEQDYKLSSGLFDNELDTIQFKKLTSRKTKARITEGLDGTPKTETRIETFARMPDYERRQFENFISDVAALTPIHKRVEVSEI